MFQQFTLSLHHIINDSLSLHMRHLLFILWMLGILLPSAIQAKETDQSELTGCPIVKIEAERLSDLNIPRSGHSAFVANGEVTVVGGHTSGFVLTPTAEYFKDGQWHLLQTVYAHDGGFSVVLKSGKVLLAGGFKDNLGISQSYEVEMYDPATHHFDGFGCLDQKRASATAIELDSGKVLITGNWYADDGMECFDGQTSFSHVKTIRQSRYLPHLFHTSDGDVLVVGGYDSKGQPIDSLIVERMKGEPFHASLFETWHPLQYDLAIHSDDSFIGDDTYLMPVQDKNGQMALVEVRDTLFSLLATDQTIPMESQWGKITYYTPVYADRQHQCGYVMGCDSTGRQYALCINYTETPVQLTLYHTDPLTDGTTITIPVMMEDGNLMLTGIKTVTKPNFNFYPSAQVWLLHFNDDSEAASDSNYQGWLWAGLVVVAFVIVMFGFAVRKRRLPEPEQPSEPVSVKDDELMQRISRLMDKEKPYLSSELKVSDLADKLGTSSRNISDCIKNTTDNTFANFINAYRINYAKQLMSNQPDMKLSEVYLRSGFANETTFFRIFKAITGITPSEWKNNNKSESSQE